MSVKNCFKNSSNKRLKSLFADSISKGLSSEDAVVAVVKQFAAELSGKVKKFSGIKQPILTGAFERLTKDVTVDTVVEKQSVRIVDEVYEATSLDGAKNKVFNLFKKVLLDPKYYEEMMTPIDNDTFKIGSLSMIKDVVPQAYDIYAPIQAMLKKFAFQLGGEGVGAAANNHSDHILTQGKRLTGFFQQGEWGNKHLDEKLSKALTRDEHIFIIDYINDYKLSKGEDALSKAEAVELKSIKITGTLSELISAFVDIANEKAMIARANWGSLFNNYGMALIRAGVHPYKVSALLAQPVMRELTKKISINEGIIENENSEKIANDILESIKGFTPASRNIPVDLGNLDFITMINDVKKDLTDSSIDYDTQIKILLHYLQTKTSMKKYNNFVLAAKVDAKGAGSNINDLIIEINRLSEGFTFDGSTGIKDVWRKYYDSSGKPTITYTQYNNTVQFLLNFMQENSTFFNGMNIGVIQRLQEISNLSRDEGRLLDNNSTEFITNAFENYKMLFFEPLTKTDSEESRKVFNDRIRALKKKGKYVILNKLLLDEEGFYRMDRIARKDPDTKNNLSDSWRLLLEKEQSIGNYLVRESYRKKGFKPGPQQFYQLIPFEWFSENNYEEHMLNDVVLDLDFIRYAMKEDIDRSFFKHLNGVTHSKLGETVFTVLPLTKDLGLGKTANNSMFIPPILAKVDDINLMLSKVIKIEGTKDPIAIYTSINNSPISDAQITQIYPNLNIEFTEPQEVTREIPKIINLDFERGMKMQEQNISNSKSTIVIENLNCTT